MGLLRLTTWLFLATCLATMAYADDAGHGHGHGDADEHSHKHDEVHGEAEEAHHHAETPAVEFTSEVMSKWGISLERPKPARLSILLPLNGRIRTIEDRVAHIVPRFSGVIKDVRKQLGDPVSKGEVLAVIESNQSLQPYEVKSLTSGTVVKRHATLGEFVSEETDIFTVADLSELWADLYLFEPDFGKPKVGQRVLIRHAEREVIESTVSFISALVDESTQSMFVRAVLNGDRSLFPGHFVTGEVTIDEFDAPRTIDLSAVQSLDGKEVVYVRHGESFEVVAVKLGRRDRKRAELLDGLDDHDEYAVGDTFVLKAELGKSEAEHEH